MQNRQPANWLMLAILVCVWGSSFALLKIAVQQVAPIWVVALRLTIAAIVLIGVARAQGVRVLPGRQLLAWFAWLGLIGNVAPFLLITWGTQFIPSSLAGILMGVVPIIVVMLAHFLLADERMTGWKAVGVAIGFVGVVILIGPKALLGLIDTDLSLVAKLAVAAAAACYALNGVTARLMPPSPALSRSAGSIAAAALLALPVAMTVSPEGLSGITPAAAAAILALGLLPTALAALVLFRLLDNAGASFVSYSNYLVPPFALIVGWVFLGEQPDSAALIGMAVILAGILVATRR